MPVSRADGEGERLLPVRLGRPDELPAKIAQLRWVLPSATADGEYLDLMCAGRAAYLKIGNRRSPPEPAAPKQPAEAPGQPGAAVEAPPPSAPTAGSAAGAANADDEAAKSAAEGTNDVSTAGR